MPSHNDATGERWSLGREASERARGDRGARSEERASVRGASEREASERGASDQRPSEEPSGRPVRPGLAQWPPGFKIPLSAVHY